MGGGLMQLVAYGAQDIYLTGNPQITFFKVVYRRHTNFSMETISQTLDGNGSIGSSQNEASCTIARNGDLIHKMYVAVLKANSSEINKGSNIVASSELEIGGQKIDKHTTEWNNIWNELTTPDSKAIGLLAMQSDSGIAGGDIGVGMVQVPLNFWFCRNPGLALPLIALQYHEVKINFVFGSFNDVRTDSDLTTDIPVKFYVDYIYLDTDERRRFAQVSHEYLIEQVQMQSMASDRSQELTFNHPIKELIWTGNNYQAATLKLNGLDRFEKQEKEYFQLRQPFDYHTSVPKMNLSHGLRASFGGASLEANLLNNPVTLDNSNDLASTLQNNTFTVANVTTPNRDMTLATSSNTAYIFGADAFKTDAAMAQDDIFLIVMSGSASGNSDTSINQTSSVIEVQSALDTANNLGSLNDTDLAFQVFTRFEHLKDDYAGGADVLEIIGIHKMNQEDMEHAYTSKYGIQINVYSFALSPEDHQPSGTCNFSRIDTAILEFDAEPTAGNIYAVNYNVLRIMSGMGGLAYSN